VYVATLLEPKVGDIIERYYINDDSLIGVFLVTEIHNPIDQNGHQRRDVIRVTCIFNEHLGVMYSMYTSVEPGASTWIHKVHLLDHWNAKYSEASYYYKIRNK